jgi:hypothetical protein
MGEPLIAVSLIARDFTQAAFADDRRQGRGQGVKARGGAHPYALAR